MTITSCHRATSWFSSLWHLPAPGGGLTATKVERTPIVGHLISMHGRWVIVAIVLAGGCSGYESSYQPPDAYRARAVWSDDGMTIAGMDQVPTCDLDSITAEPVEVAPGETRDSVRMMTVGPHGNWIPITLVGWHHYNPFFFLFPHQVIAEAIHLGSGGPVVGSTAGGGSVPSLGGSGDGAAYVLAVLAVVAILASSVIAVGLAVSDPEDGDEIAATIDEVNRINDEARQVMADCMQQLQGDTP